MGFKYETATRKISRIVTAEKSVMATSSIKSNEVLTTKTFHGYDVDPEIVRLALMNLILHGIEGAHVRRKDTVAGAEDEGRFRRFDVVLTNPPFAGKVDRERIKPTLPVKSNKTQVLFWAMLSILLSQMAGPV